MREQSKDFLYRSDQPSSYNLAPLWMYVPIHKYFGVQSCQQAHYLWPHKPCAAPRWGALSFPPPANLRTQKWALCSLITALISSLSARPCITFLLGALTDDFCKALMRGTTPHGSLLIRRRSWCARLKCHQHRERTPLAPCRISVHGSSLNPYPPLINHSALRTNHGKSRQPRGAHLYCVY